MKICVKHVILYREIYVIFYDIDINMKYSRAISVKLVKFEFYSFK